MHNINNNINNPDNFSYKAQNKDNNPMLNKEERMNILILQVKELLLQNAQREVPLNGQFRKVVVGFKIPETQNKALLTIEHDELDPKTQRRLSLSVHHQNSDRLISNYLAKGTKEEILDYLKDSSNTSSLIHATNHLSNKIDDYFSTLQ